MPIFNTTISGGGSPTPTPTRKYGLLDRVKDDSNNDVGIVVGFFYDANNTEYAVVAVNAANRAASLKTRDESSEPIPDWTTYSGGLSAYGIRETATQTCDQIMDYVSGGFTSPSVSHCRSLSFTIGGNSYAGQLPNVIEIVQIAHYKSEINAGDPTATANPSLVINDSLVSSTRVSSFICLGIKSTGYLNNCSQTTAWFVAPVLEIPNT